MKKLFFSLAIIAFTSVLASAQKSGFNISAQGGISVSKCENTFTYPDNHKTGKLFKGFGTLNLGYDFSDKFGMRLSGSYGGNAGAFNSKESSNNFYPYKFNSVNVFVDAILNFNTQERSFSPKLYAGVGGAHTFNYKNDFDGVPVGVAKKQYDELKSSYNTFGFRFGFIAQYDFDSNFGIYADLCGEAYTHKYNGLKKEKGASDTGFPFDMRGMVSLGIIYHF